MWVLSSEKKLWFLNSRTQANKRHFIFVALLERNISIKAQRRDESASCTEMKFATLQLLRLLLAALEWLTNFWNDIIASHWCGGGDEKWGAVGITRLVYKTERNAKYSMYFFSGVTNFYVDMIYLFIQNILIGLLCWFVYSV